MKRLLAAALLLTYLFLCACTGKQTSSTSTGLQLYFLSSDPHGPAIAGQPYSGSQSPSPDTLLRSLLAGPDAEGLYSPFPSNLTLRGCVLTDGCLHVDFSEQYGGLTDVALTLADYCVVLTVCQLEGIDKVEITVAGSGAPYRSHQILTVQEAVLTS